MNTLIPVAMNSSGQQVIAQPGDIISGGWTRLFTGTSVVTITNSTVETSVIGTGLGSKTIPTAFWTPGAKLYARNLGVYSAAVTPGNLTAKAKLGSTVLASTTLTSLLSLASTLGYESTCEITCATSGASGVLIVTGYVGYTSSSVGARLFNDLNNSGNTVSIDLSVDLIFDATVQFSVASTSNIIKSQSLSFSAIF